MFHRRWQGVVLLFVMAGVLSVSQGDVVETRAATVYTYIDDQGNPVFTDSPETIPEKYRAKVKTHERPDSVKKSPSAVDRVHDTVKEQAKRFGFDVPSVGIDLKKYSLSQSPILTYAGIAAIVLLLIMYVSKDSPMIRLLALGLLIVLGIGTPVLMYSTDGGPMDTLKKNAATAGQVQHDRLRQAPQ